MNEIQDSRFSHRPLGKMAFVLLTIAAVGLAVFAWAQSDHPYRSHMLMAFLEAIVILWVRAHSKTDLTRIVMTWLIGFLVAVQLMFLFLGSVHPYSGAVLKKREIAAIPMSPCVREMVDLVVRADIPLRRQRIADYDNECKRQARRGSASFVTSYN